MPGLHGEIGGLADGVAGGDVGDRRRCARASAPRQPGSAAWTCANSRPTTRARSERRTVAPGWKVWFGNTSMTPARGHVEDPALRPVAAHVGHQRNRLAASPGQQRLEARRRAAPRGRRARLRARDRRWLRNASGMPARSMRRSSSSMRVRYSGRGLARRGPLERLEGRAQVAAGGLELADQRVRRRRRRRRAAARRAPGSARRRAAPPGARPGPARAGSRRCRATPRRPASRPCARASRSPRCRAARASAISPSITCSRSVSRRVRAAARCGSAAMQRLERGDRLDAAAGRDQRLGATRQGRAGSRDARASAASKLATARRGVARRQTRVAVRRPRRIERRRAARDLGEDRRRFVGPARLQARPALVVAQA